MGSIVIPPQPLVNLHQLDVNFWKVNNIFWASNKQTKYWNWLFDVWWLHLGNRILEVWCAEEVMIYCKNDNNAYCWTVNAQTFEIIEHDTV